MPQNASTDAEIMGWRLCGRRKRCAVPAPSNVDSTRISTPWAHRHWRTFQKLQMKIVFLWEGMTKFSTVRFCDAGLSDDLRESRSGRFYWWPGEKLERIAKVQTRSTSPKFRPSVSDGTGLCCLGGTAGADEYLEYHRLWRQNGRLQTDPWLCSPGRSHEKVSSPIKWQGALCQSVV
ncbi:hypothetical protein PCH_Pc24g01890 [Penicillium rubens Wisconsin 54-1255]|uniref:Uncharacterized protein n=1 Tax=Penicillium rubens (strain ATCC 28089 / DSM 1075 / NRRL 1951 / Wisconsin 54-1255) TaxID=500485 RepID=B6HWX7_PENRW|nr:hypothetical protein PCH_Pc24g01890 [Penicillium rubens Wisconsin 54-1255]